MLVTELYDTKTDEKLMLVLLLGALEALLQKRINPEEIQMIIPRLALEKKVDPKVQYLLEEAWEFEDVNELCPEAMKKSILDMKKRTLELLSKYDAYPDEMWLGFDLDD